MLGALLREHHDRVGDDDLTPLSLTKRWGLVPAVQRFGRALHGKDVARYRVVLPDDIVIDPMLLWDGAIARSHRTEPGFVSPDYRVFRANPSAVDLSFLEQWFCGDAARSAFENEARGTNVRRNRIGRADFLRIEMMLPPLPEQKKIAAILSSVDDAIRATQAVIDQTRRVKEGLLHDLLTRGIGPDGKPHTRFKRTEIGMIPEGWEVRPVGDLLTDKVPAMRSGPFGSALLKEELVDEGIPFLGIDNVQVERFVPEYRRFVSKQKYEQLKRYAVRSGDIMITIMGTVGRCCVVPDDIGPALSSKHTWTLTLDTLRYRPYLACAQINHAKWVKSHFEADQQGGTMAAIRSETLRSLRLPVPPPDEQRRIETLLHSVDSETQTSTDILQSLQSTKSALLSDLLTGRVRVTP